MEIIPLGIIWYVVFVFSTTVHEAAHGFAAMKLGDRTAYHGGHVTLNPAVHIRQEPFGMVIVPLITFVLGGWMLGWASVPYDRYWADRYPQRAAIMSLAGPASNLCLVILAGILVHIGIGVGFFYAPESIGFSTVVESNADGIGMGLAAMVSIMFTLNLVLFVFNMMPIVPLDGAGCMGVFLRKETLSRYREMMSRPAVGIIGLIVAWRVFYFMFGQIHLWALNLLYPGSGYQ